jgi:hypothetical protein
VQMKSVSSFELYSLNDETEWQSLTIHLFSAYRNAIRLTLSAWLASYATNDVFSFSFLFLPFLFLFPALMKANTRLFFSAMLFSSGMSNLGGIF